MNVNLKLEISTQHIHKSDTSMMIYLAINKLNSKIYVGQTVRQFEERKAQHLRDAKKGSDCPFHKALREYGEENFEWRLVYKADTLEELNRIEKVYIAWLDTLADNGNGYNFRIGGCNHVSTDTAKQKMSEAKKGARHPRACKIVLEDYLTEDKMYFDTQQQAADFLGVTRSAVNKIIDSGKKIISKNNNRRYYVAKANN